MAERVVRRSALNAFVVIAGCCTPHIMLVHEPMQLSSPQNLLCCSQACDKQALETHALYSIKYWHRLEMYIVRLIHARHASTRVFCVGGFMAEARSYVMRQVGLVPLELFVRNTSKVASKGSPGSPTSPAPVTSGGRWCQLPFRSAKSSRRQRNPSVVAILMSDSDKYTGSYRIIQDPSQQAKVRPRSRKRR